MAAPNALRANINSHAFSRANPKLESAPRISRNSILLAGVTKQSQNGAERRK